VLYAYQLAGQSILVLAPNVLTAVNLRASKTQKVAAALPVNAWIQGISDAPYADGIIHFITWINQEFKDEIIWHLSAPGEYTSKSAYRALFEGTMTLPHHNSIWDCWAPLKCKVFAWLASLD
jgi:hypothetical protein